MDENNIFTIESKAFDNSRAKFNEALKGLINVLLAKQMPGGSITMKVNIDMMGTTVLDPETGELKTMFMPDIETKVKYGFSASAADKTKEQNSKIVISKRADGNLQLIDAEDPQLRLSEV